MKSDSTARNLKWVSGVSGFTYASSARFIFTLLSISSLANVGRLRIHLSAPGAHDEIHGRRLQIDSPVIKATRPSYDSAEIEPGLGRFGVSGVPRLSTAYTISSSLWAPEAFHFGSPPRRVTRFASFDMSLLVPSRRWTQDA